MTENFLSNIISDEEILCRFIIHRSRIRGGRVTSDAFIPPRDLQMSVTRRIEIDQNRVDHLGKRFGQKQGVEYLGSADLSAGVIRNAHKGKETGVGYEPLNVEAEPEVGPELDTEDHNPNHAHVVGWPVEKQKQRRLAVEIANNENTRFFPVQS